MPEKYRNTERGEKMKIGFIGLGIMGKPMSKNLLKAGNQLVVFDRNTAAVEEVVSAGAKKAASAAEVAAECRTIITMLPNSPHVRSVCLEENGVADTAKPGTVVIDMSSIDPMQSKSIGSALAEKGISSWMPRSAAANPRLLTARCPSWSVAGKKLSRNTTTC